MVGIKPVITENIEEEYSFIFVEQSILITKVSDGYNICCLGKRKQSDNLINNFNFSKHQIKIFLLTLIGENKQWCLKNCQHKST